MFWKLFFVAAVLSNLLLLQPNGETTTEPPSEEVFEDSITTAKGFPRSKFNLRRSSTVPPSTTTASTMTTSTTIMSTTRMKRTRSTTKAPVSETTPATPSTPISAQVCGEQVGDTFPWIVIIEHTNPNGKTNKKTLSKGVLIDASHVLTTVSSIHNSFPFWVVSGVRLGDTPTSATSENLMKKDVKTVGVQNVFLHERKDIAIIKLSEAVNMTDKVKPICLPKDDNYNYPELFFHICHKVKDTFVPQSHSKFISVTPLSSQDCHIMFRRKQALFTNKELCAWDETGDTCTGDLGGPLLAKVNGRYHVIGLNSYVQAKKNIDAEGLPGVYTRVGAHLKWIDAVLNTTFD